MTEVSAGTASAAEASSRPARGQDTSEFSEVSFTSTASEDQDADFPAPLLSEASTANLIPAQISSTENFASSSSWNDVDTSVAEPSSSIKPISSTHKGKQPSNGHYIDPDQHKSGYSLSTIDETSAAGASAYAHPASSHSSSNGYGQDDDRRRYRDHVRIGSPDTDEAPYSPTTYPPTSEEDSEAKRVQQNLERWAAEERQRRKAQRSSKILTNRNSTVSGGGTLAHRLSILRSGGYSSNGNNLGAGPSSERLADGPGASPSMPYRPHLAERARETQARRGSASSSAGGARGLHRTSSSSSLESSESHGSLVSDDHRPNRKLPPIGSRVQSANHAREASGGSANSLKGLGHDANGSARDPFRDPSENDASPGVSHKRSSVKPTPTASRPIVTVGRASSIQRRALESSYTSKGKGKGRSMPTIVATDTEAEAEAEAEELSSRHADRAENPFASSQDRHRSKAPTSTTIHQGGLDEEVAMEFAGRGGRGLEINGDLGESTLDSDNGARPLPARTSTSSSKFRELGITESDDWIESMGRSMGKDRSRKMRIASNGGSSDNEREEVRKPWWTELLCGCSRDYDDDEQAGRTNPME
ncbi:uncharacterized protein UTRI_05436_B [Ustilago trichophora]|uniref:Uncharacterized protein n=1 Tax=Ustilago trichophora TaxID=86804 RepID=A0A5C3ELF7_9BASI|nr:uncharacterized protein UTRI_05436_B [Ustilago trichophora]